jgi:hypothetical protein
MNISKYILRTHTKRPNINVIQTVEETFFFHFNLTTLIETLWEANQSNKLKFNTYVFTGSICPHSKHCHGL